jgi:feruloyl-CoA synthase
MPPNQAMSRRSRKTARRRRRPSPDLERAVSHRVTLAARRARQEAAPFGTMAGMPLASPALAPARVIADRRADGALVLTSPHPLGEVPRHLVDLLRRWAGEAPDRLFLADRSGPDRVPRRVTYGETRTLVDRLAEGLLRRGLSPERPLLILSENGVDHALLTLAAMTAGVPVTPVSAAYSLLSNDLEKLRAIAGILGPGLVWAADAERYARAFGALAGSGATLVASRGASGSVLPLDALLQDDPGAELEARFAAQTPGTVAKVLFTSGSTGLPKGVVNTQGMLCSNQAAVAVVWPFLKARPPVVLDWLPWSHTFGGNHNFNMVLFHGGALHVDDGRPTPDLVERTLDNIRAVSPTIYFNVPRGFDVILPFLERDASLREAFFRELDVIFYAAASLSNPAWERLEAQSLSARGELVLMLSAWGSTETSPLATTVHWRIRRAGVIGLPAPGTAIKLAPVGNKLELRVKGPGVTPGYHRRPDLGATAFDEEGFFRMGDAGKLVDPDDPAQGIAFDGRIAEDFKLGSGTWVHVGALRTAVVAAGAPYVQDAVVAGIDREEIGILVFLSPIACRELCPGVPFAELGARPEVRSFLAAAYRRYNADNPTSSVRVPRLLVLAEPPSIDANEITDKGYVNQRAVLERRAALVERLYAGTDAEVIRP